MADKATSPQIRATGMAVMNSLRSLGGAEARIGWPEDYYAGNSGSGCQVRYRGIGANKESCCGYQNSQFKETQTAAEIEQGAVVA